MKKSNNHNTMIRHSGRALIRGKIRRVWRPRYLELCDNGLVKYYEQESPHIVKCVLRIFQARIIDVTTLRDVHVGLPMGSFGFLFHAQRALYPVVNMECHPPEHLQARDFLCAVPTLEEAQSWVVALQWAAAEQQRRQHDDDDLFLKGRDAFQVISTVPERIPKKEKQSKTVVTKVQSLQLVRAHGWHVELAYAIHMLLLRTQSQQVTVEERIILRTLDDIQNMVNGLKRQLTNEKSLQVLDQVELPEDLLMYSDYVTSIPQVDRMLRALAMDPLICNSQAMRTFWSLNVDSVTNSSGLLSLLHAHDSKSLVAQRQLPSPRNTKNFVQKWLGLQQDSKQHPSEMELYCISLSIWLLQRPALVVGGVATVVVLLPPILQLYQQWMVSANVRLDVLLLSWAVSALIGREYERRLKSLRERIVPLRPEVTRPTPGLLEEDESISLVDVHSVTSEDELELEHEVDGALVPDEIVTKGGVLSSPLPQHPNNGGVSCWSMPESDIFRVRGVTYLQDRIKIPSAPAPFECLGVDIWLTDNPERHISRHPAVLGGKLGEQDTFVVNFLLPFGNFVAYFGIPPISKFPSKLANVWTKFLDGDQQYRDARLKLLPVVIDGPWIVKTAVGPSTSPALLGKVIPLQYYFRSPSDSQKGVYEVDIIITASRIAQGILSVVKGYTNMLTMAFAFIIEAAEEEELPETVLCTFQMHSIHLEGCPQLPECNLDEIETE